MASLQRLGQAPIGLLSRSGSSLVPRCASHVSRGTGARSLRVFRRCFSRLPALHADLLVKVPQMAESISEGMLSTFLKQVGDRIDADDELASIETDKIDVAVNAPEGGVLAELLVQEGDVVTVGQPIARIETGAAAESSAREPEQRQEEPKSIPKPEESSSSETQTPAQPEPPRPETPQAAPQTPVAPVSKAEPAQQQQYHYESESSGNRGPSRMEREEKMSRMRKTIATRLKQSQNICASLTTMQEIDMSALMAWRAKYKEEVAETHGVRLGYMGAFTKATTLAAQQVPQINASIDTDREIITYRDYVDISIAVSSPKGLITPVVRNTEARSIVELEREIALLAQKARESKLTMDDLQGGNFSISNPGIFGSMFGTPLINYPQAAVFNMNSIMQRPVVVDGKLEIRPMMYVTITYDHRLIDGREAVTFLNAVKKYIQDPSRMLLA